MNIPTLSVSGNLYKAELNNTILYFYVNESLSPKKVTFCKQDEIPITKFEGDSDMIWASFSQWTQSVILSRFKGV